MSTRGVVSLAKFLPPEKRGGTWLAHIEPNGRITLTPAVAVPRHDEANALPA